MLELLDDDTAVLVVSDHGAQRLDGGFCVNEWLVREGLLVAEPVPERGHAVRQARGELGKTRCGAKAATTRACSST